MEIWENSKELRKNSSIRQRSRSLELPLKPQLDENTERETGRINEVVVRRGSTTYFLISKHSRLFYCSKSTNMIGSLENKIALNTLPWSEKNTLHFWLKIIKVLDFLLSFTAILY